jgi:hypothetical protein
VQTVGGKIDVSLDHPDTATAAALLTDALGTANPDFLTGLVFQLLEADGTVNERSLSWP